MPPTASASHSGKKENCSFARLRDGTTVTPNANSTNVFGNWSL